MDGSEMIGVVGGMGTYATVDFFKRLADAFPAEKEWERPRIMIDNNCTMPSRVRALLYGERRKELVADLADSMRHLLQSGATMLVLACNTSHCFLDEIYQLLPEAKPHVIHIIEACGKELRQNQVESVSLLASEGTIQSGIYEKTLAPCQIRVESPRQELFGVMRGLIEDVKQNKITDATLRQFVELINGADRAVVLGCTEFPVLYRLAVEKSAVINRDVYDPLGASITYIKQIIEKRKR